jgi:DNA/RNA-binding domain of Phe-tRNA-synthetase-like protein
VSVLHQVALGGEDLDRYTGAPLLLCATGQEPLDTTSGGETVVELPDTGEVVWCDDVGVTCRRWNRRQAQHTQLTNSTTAALFILDGLEPLTVNWTPCAPVWRSSPRTRCLTLSAAGRQLSEFSSQAASA